MGVYGDNYSAITFSDNQDYTSSSSEVNDCMDYYFIYGSNAGGVLAQMRDLVGSVSMFPLDIRFLAKQRALQNPE